MTENFDMKPVPSHSRSTISRREFFRTAAGAGAAMTFPSIVPSSVFGAGAPSNRITVGIIACGGMGEQNLNAFHALDCAQILAICDVDKKRRDPHLSLLGLDEKSSYNDFREVLARSDIDAVAISTPDHWHVPISIAAARAGKDIYCEKPLSLTVREGRLLCEAVRRYGCVFQTGSMQRSMAQFRQACELVRNGRIGSLLRMNTGIPGNNPNPLRWKEEPVPDGFDYEMWLGPAPRAPYNPMRCHYNFRFNYDYSGGQMTNWGAHHFDIAQWANGADSSGPVEVEGKAEYPSDGLFNTAEHVELEYTYANGVKLLVNKQRGKTFEGTEGWIAVSRDGIDAHPKSILKSVIRPDEIHLYDSKDHYLNFIDCIKRRKNPICDVEVGHRSATVCHIGNIAMRLGRKLRWDPAAEQFVNDEEANRLLSRPMRSPWHL